MAHWAIQQQLCEAKFEVWHRYGTQSPVSVQYAGVLTSVTANDYLAVFNRGCPVPTNFLMCIATLDSSSLRRQRRLRKDVEYPTIFSASDTARFQSVTFADDPHILAIRIPYSA